MKSLFLSILCCFLFSCNAKDISYNYPDNPDYARKSRAGMLFSENDLVLYGKKKDEARKSEIGKIADAEKQSGKFDEKSLAKSSLASSPLWKSSIEVMSALLPLAIIDANSGVIISEWHQEKAEERIKIHALIKGTELSKENVQITIFRQKKSVSKADAKTYGNDWQPSSREDSASQALSAKLLQEKILERAQK